MAFNIFFQKGIQHIKARRFKLAELCYKKCIQIDASCVSAYVNLGLALFEQEKLNQAVESLKYAISLEPSRWESYFALASIYYRSGDFDNSLECLENILKLNPHYLDAYLTKFKVLSALKRFQEADRILEFICRANPEKASYYLPQWEYLHNEWLDRFDAEFQKYDSKEYAEQIQRNWNPNKLEFCYPLGLTSAESPVNYRSHPNHNMMITYGYILTRISRQLDKISILDWGGGGGGYYLLSRALIPDLNFDYHIKELPRVCQVCEELLPDVTWHDRDSTCFQDKYDLVMAIGSLQYSKEWKKTLKQLICSSKKYLLIGRLPIVLSTRSFVVIQRFQNIYNSNTESLNWFLNRDEIMELTSTYNMKLVREFIFDFPIFPYKASEPGQILGFLFERQ